MSACSRHVKWKKLAIAAHIHAHVYDRHSTRRRQAGGRGSQRIPNRDAQFCRSRRSRTPPESRAKPEEDQPGAGRGAVRAQ